MEPRRPPEYTIDLLADRSNIRDVVRAVLHTIFFHRYFVPLTPSTHEILDLTVPYVSADEVESLIDARAQTLSQTLPQTGRAQLIIQFLERKRKKATGLGWFGGSKSSDDEQVWENWVVDIAMTDGTRTRRREVERSLQKAVLKVVQIANRDRAHIPPITTNETNPFPFQISVKEHGSSGSKASGGIF